MPSGELFPLALLILAVGLASLNLTSLLVPAGETGRRYVVETSIGTCVSCTGIGLAFQGYGLAAGVACLVAAAISCRFFPRRPAFETAGTWVSAALLLAYLAQTT
jgi:hypothetical protein